MYRTDSVEVKPAGYHPVGVLCPVCTVPGALFGCTHCTLPCWRCAEKRGLKVEMLPVGLFEFECPACGVHDWLEA